MLGRMAFSKSLFSKLVLAGGVIGGIAGWIKSRQNAPEPVVEPAPEPVAYEQLRPEITEAEKIEEAKWVQPVDGACPASHPIKARFSTGHYHLADDRDYAKVVPDSCYASEEAAQADGFSRIK